MVEGNTFLRYLLILVCMCILQFENGHSQTIRRRLTQISRIVDRLNNSVTNLEEGNQKCNSVLSVVSESISNIDTSCSSKVEHLQQELSNISKHIDDIDTSGFSGTAIEIDKTHDADKVCMNVPKTLEECMKSFEGHPIDTTIAQVDCLQKLIWVFEPVTVDPRLDADVLEALVNKTDRRHPKSTGGRVRKEYRHLSFGEKKRFHDALNELYKDGTVSVFGRIHSRAVGPAHRGPAFLPWHRAFLALFEEALREKDPSVSLPYWDSSIDNDMDNPTNSMLWTEMYMGNGAGEVNIGPFAGWVSSSGRLEREFGRGSRLISKKAISNVLTKCRLTEISNPTADRLFNLEWHHDGVHIWVGADMGSVPTAAYDPIFYLHHAFIDQIWEQFRKHQKADCNVNPSTDFPIVVSRNGHAANDAMSGMMFFANKDGLMDWWTGGTNPWYTYADQPKCPDCGSTQALMCDRKKNTCIPRSRFEPILPLSTMIPVTTTESLFMASSFSTAFVSSSSRAAFVPSTSIKTTTKPRKGPLRPVQPLFVPDVTDIQDVITKDIMAEFKLVPKNRGVKFFGPPNDGRTLMSSLQDIWQVRQSGMAVGQRLEDILVG